MSNEDIVSSIEAGNRLPGYLEDIRSEFSKNPRSIVILDDDPTGTQTVYDVPVITVWTTEVLEKELLVSPVFFILTNSRSLQAKAANDLGKLLGKRLQNLAKKHQKNLLVVSRGDSTLRGHYPNEVEALVAGLGWSNTKHILAPAFFEGGRYTFDDVHYVKEGDAFIPAAETPFAKDNTFGYAASNLKDWIVEKTEGKVAHNKISSVSLDALRTTSTENIKALFEQPEVSHIVANATTYADLQALALACLKYKGPLVFRTGASFVNAITAIEAKDCLTKNQILGKHRTGGTLIVIGSYVPKTTQQLDYLKENSDALFLEFDVSNVLEPAVFQKEIEVLAEKVDLLISAEEKVVLYTSRTIVKGATKAESLEIVNLVSNGLISIIKQLNNQPKYILAKGGITSSDVATKGLSVQRALVLGQVKKGVPVWRLGEEAKFPDMPYIVFPGNVGDNTSLYQVIKLLE
ncbi:four-carbon acid sugar kinase family protein [Maribacter sp. 2308TA10-17]|uniref:four-carbon acid sugar kinase family protein n=1 Tax=Maribacter sp. 2308TA10-17 TaxID=3386276 RepID=UPI0039BD71A6